MVFLRIYRAVCRSREGAWIEIKTKKTLNITLNVAPARERGLKLKMMIKKIRKMKSRSREGAWIEICLTVGLT